VLLPATFCLACAIIASLLCPTTTIMFANPPWPFHLVAVVTRLYHPSFISCTFEFNRSTPRTFYPPHIPTYPTFAVSYHSLAYYFLLYMAFLLHSHSSSYLLSCIPYLPFCPLTHTPNPQNPLLPSSSISHQQIHSSKHARAKTYCLKYSLPPATLSLSLPRRYLGRTRW